MSAIKRSVGQFKSISSRNKRPTYIRIPYNGASPASGGHVADKQKPRQKPARENAVHRVDY